MRKKWLALALAGLLGVTSVACGKSETKTTEEKNGKEKLVVWTLADDLKQFADHYTEKNPNVEVETIVIAPADYLTKIQSAMRGKATEPDIIVAEPQMLETMYEAGYLEDLDQAPYEAQKYSSNVVDYVWKAGQDENGVQRAISYQITPAGVFYRRDIAKKVFGTEEPAEISKYFADYNTILKTGETLKKAGYKIFASDSEMGYFSGNSAWVVDGKLNIDQDRKDYMDLCVQLYQQDMTAYVGAWSAPWYQAMSGPVPMIDASTNVWDEEEMKKASETGKTTEVFAFGLPSWGVLVMRDHVEELSGKWGVCQGPAYGFGGGTFLGINALSKKKELAWDFLKFVTMDEETLDWWVKVSEGDVVSWVPTIEKYKNEKNEVYGGQKLYEFFLEQAQGIDYSKVTKYDKVINDAWGTAIESIKTNQMSKEEAMNNFYDVVQSTYPELEITR